MRLWLWFLFITGSLAARLKDPGKDEASWSPVKVVVNSNRKGLGNDFVVQCVNDTLRLVFLNIQSNASHDHDHHDHLLLLLRRPVYF